MSHRLPIVLAFTALLLGACHEPSTEDVWRPPDQTAWREAYEAQRRQRAVNKPARPPIPGGLQEPGVTPPGQGALNPGQVDRWDYRDVRPPLRVASPDIGPRQWQTIDRYYHRRGMHFDPNRGTVDATHDFDTRLAPPVYLDRLDRYNTVPRVYQQRWEMLNLSPNERRPADIDAGVEHRVRESRP